MRPRALGTRRGCVTAAALTVVLATLAVASVASSATAVGARSDAEAVAAGRARSATTAQAQSSPLIAFVRYGATSPGTIWVTRKGGGGQMRLGPGEQPLVSPRGGQYVAAASAGSKGAPLLVYSIEGGSTRTFFSSVHATATPLAWSPNGRYLAVALLGTSVNSTRGSGLAVIDTKTWTAAPVAKGIIYGASFDPDGAAELVFASAASQLGDAPVNLRTVSVAGDGSTPHGALASHVPTPLTHDGRSLFPVWGAKGIVFDREQLRGVSKAPEYQVWLMAGSKLEQLTSLKVAALVDGLVPMEVSADGNRIAAEFVGEDTSYAWTIQITPREVSQVRIGHQYVQGAGISSDGTRLLVDVGDFEQSSSRGFVETLAFGGGGVVKVTQGADASWSG